MSALPHPFSAKPQIKAEPSDTRAAAVTAIRNLQRRASYGLYVLAIFLLLSFAALDSFSFLPSFTKAFRESLGTGPTPSFISMALVVYLFSAVIMVLARMMSGSGQTGGFMHLGYLGAFYGFYHLSGALVENIWAVLGSGVTILSLEAYQLWNYCHEEIGRIQETLNILNRFPDKNDTPSP